MTHVMIRVVDWTTFFATSRFSSQVYIYFFFVKFFSHLPSTLLLVTLCISRGHKCLYVYLSLCYFSPLFFCVYVYVCVRINISLAGSRPLIVRSHVHSLDISHSPTLSLPRPSARVVKQPSLASPFFPSIFSSER